jgi:hypothetical protein
MGWFYSSDCRSKNSLVDSLIRDANFRSSDGECRTLKHRIVGNHLWMALEQTPAGKDTSRFVVLYLLHQSDGCWGYKSMDEAMGPYYYDCPQSVIDACGPTSNNYAQAWRDKVIAHRRHNADRKALVATLKRGDVVSLDDDDSKRFRVSSVGRNIIGVSLQDGAFYGLPAKRITAVYKHEDISSGDSAGI